MWQGCKVNEESEALLYSALPSALLLRLSSLKILSILVYLLFFEYPFGVFSTFATFATFWPVAMFRRRSKQISDWKLKLKSAQSRAETEAVPEQSSPPTDLAWVWLKLPLYVWVGKHNSSSSPALARSLSVSLLFALSLAHFARFCSSHGPGLSASCFLPRSLVCWVCCERNSLLAAFRIWVLIVIWSWGWGFVSWLRGT